MAAELWSEAEHEACMQAIRQGGLGWEAVAGMVKTKTVPQIQHYLATFVAQKTQELNVIQDTLQKQASPPQPLSGTPAASTQQAADGISPQAALDSPSQAAPVQAASAIAAQPTHAAAPLAKPAKAAQAPPTTHKVSPDKPRARSKHHSVPIATSALMPSAEVKAAELDTASAATQVISAAEMRSTAGEAMREPAHSFTAPPVSAAPSASEADLRAADRELNEAVQSIGVWHSMSPFAAQATVQPHVAPSLIQAMGVDSAEDLQAVRDLFEGGPGLSPAHAAEAARLATLRRSANVTSSGKPAEMLSPTQHMPPPTPPQAAPQSRHFPSSASLPNLAAGSPATHQAYLWHQSRHSFPIPAEVTAVAAAGPNFAMIYAFLGSMFDPSCEGLTHAEVLSQMSATDQQAALLIIRNMVKNLNSPSSMQHLQALMMHTARV